MQIIQSSNYYASLFQCEIQLQVIFVPVPVELQPEFEESGISVGDNDLAPNILALWPAKRTLKMSEPVQVFHNEHVFICKADKLKPRFSFCCIALAVLRIKE